MPVQALVQASNSLLVAAQSRAWPRLALPRLGSQPGSSRGQAGAQWLAHGCTSAGSDRARVAVEPYEQSAWQHLRTSVYRHFRIVQQRPWMISSLLLTSLQTFAIN